MSKKKSEWSETYNDYAITMDDRKQFRVDELEKSFATYQLATEAIDRAAVAKAKVSKKPVSIMVVDADGGKFEITGIHAGNGNLIFRPKRDRYSHGKLYPDGTAVVSDAMKRIAEIDTEKENLERVLNDFEIEPPAPKYGNFNPEHLAAYTDRLIAVGVEKHKRAAETTLAKELDKLK